MLFAALIAELAPDISTGRCLALPNHALCPPWVMAAGRWPV